MMLMLVNAVSQLVDGALAHVEITTRPIGQLRGEPDLWRLTADNGGQLVVMKSGAPYYFFEIKRHMRNYCAEKNLIVSETFIDEQIVSLLAGAKASCAGLADIALRVKDWIADIDKTTQDDYTVVLPLNRYHFRGEVNVARIKIVKITNKKIEEETRPIPDAMKGYFNAEELADKNETDTFAIISTKANDQKSAVELAESMIDRFVYAVKLIDPNTTVTSRKNFCGGLLMSYSVYNASKGQMSVALTRLNELPVTIQSDDFYDKLNEPWARLLGFLFDDHPTDLQKSIIDALYWYGEVDAHRDTLVSQYLYYLIGLEKLLVPGHERHKAKKFGSTAAAVLHGSADHAGFYEEYYKKRNSLVHEGPVTIYKEDVDGLKIWLRSILLELVSNTDKFVDLVSYYNGVHGIEWGSGVETARGRGR